MILSKENELQFSKEIREYVNFAMKKSIGKGPSQVQVIFSEEQVIITVKGFLTKFEQYILNALYEKGYYLINEIWYELLKSYIDDFSHQLAITIHGCIDVGNFYLDINQNCFCCIFHYHINL